MNTSRIIALAAADFRALLRRRWMLYAIVLGLLVVVVVAFTADTDLGTTRLDDLRRGGASLLLLGGLAVALVFGGSTFERDRTSGHLGMLVAHGAAPAEIGLGRALSRLVALVVVMASWIAGIAVASVTLGYGVDPSFLVHGAATTLNMSLVLSGTVMMAALIGAWAAGGFGLIVYISAQAIVNIQAATDQGVISSYNGVVRAASTVLPNAVVAPVITNMQLRDVAGPAAPRLEIDGKVIGVGASNAYEVLLAIIWVGIFLLAAAGGLRRRQL
jgi:hypothetical protein